MSGFANSPKSGRSSGEKRTGRFIANALFAEVAKKRFEIVVSKRCMLTFLEVNGIHMECTNEEVVEVGLSVASGTMDYDSLLQWVRDHRI